MTKPPSRDLRERIVAAGHLAKPLGKSVFIDSIGRLAEERRHNIGRAKLEEGRPRHGEIIQDAMQDLKLGDALGAAMLFEPPLLHRK